MVVGFMLPFGITALSLGERKNSADDVIFATVGNISEFHRFTRNSSGMSMSMMVVCKQAYADLNTCSHGVIKDGIPCTTMALRMFKASPIPPVIRTSLGDSTASI